MGNRPSGDLDLFTDWQRRADFPAAVQTVVEALEGYGYAVVTSVTHETFARLLVTASGETTAEPDKVELSADWRSHAPVMLEVGPVLHPDDAVANKMGALYGRAAARDFLDIDVAVTSGRYSRSLLLGLATNAYAGFDELMFADALSALPRITDAAFTVYGIPPAEIAAMRERFADWRDQLRQ